MSLKRELESKFGIYPKMKIAMGELEVRVDGRRVFSHKQTGSIPGTDALLAAIVVAGDKQS